MWTRVLKAKKVKSNKIMDFFEKLSPSRLVTKYVLAPKDKWFEEGDKAYIYIPLREINLIKNISTKEIDQELKKEIEETNGQQVTIVSIDTVESGHKYLGDVTPVSLTVKLENGQTLKNIPAEWLSKEKADPNKGE